MGRPSTEELKLRCRAHYLRWLLQYLIDHPEGYPVGEATMTALQHGTAESVGDVAIDAFAAGFYARGDVRHPADMDRAEPVLRGIWDRLQAGV